MSKKPQEENIQEAASMTQVRELLFGTQLKDMELRFQRQEELLLREINNVRDSIKSRLDSLEGFMRSENGTLLLRLQEEQNERDSAMKTEQRERTELLKTEQRERAEAVAALGVELAAAVETADRKIAKVAGTLDAVERELRELLLKESNMLSSKVEERYQDALSVLSSSSSHLRHDAVHRSALSGMFAEMAIKLSRQMTMDMEPLLLKEEGEQSGEDRPEEEGGDAEKTARWTAEPETSGDS
jgi:seryl-tRNA synthetase